MYTLRRFRCYNVPHGALYAAQKKENENEIKKKKKKNKIYTLAGRGSEGSQKRKTSV